jgi:hypothetical protein
MRSFNRCAPTFEHQAPIPGYLLNDLVEVAINRWCPLCCINGTTRSSGLEQVAKRIVRLARPSAKGLIKEDSKSQKATGLSILNEALVTTDTKLQSNHNFL